MAVRVFLLGLVALLVAGCGGSAAPIAPVTATPGTSASPGVKTSPTAPASAAATASPKATGTPTPAPSPTTSGSAAPANLVADQATIDAVAADYGTLSHASAAADAASLQSFLASNANVVRSGDSAVLAWAQFKDGLLYVFHLDFGAPGSDAGPSAFRRGIAAAPQRPRASVRARLASSTSAPQYTLVPNNGPIYVMPNIPAVGNTAAEAGIANALGALGHPAAFQSETVNNLLQIGQGGGGAPAGLYVISHGGNITDPTKAYAPFYTLATGDVISSVTQLSPLYQSLANLNNPPKPSSLSLPPQLYVCHFVDSQGTLVESLGVTNSFFEQHVVFGPDSFVFLNADQSDDTDNPSSGIPELVAVFKASGVQTYLGWTGNVSVPDARETANFLFDRWLGESPATAGMFVGGPSQESPPERPFSLGEVLAYAGTFARQDGANSGSSPNAVTVDQSCGAQNASLAGHGGPCDSVLDSFSNSSGATLQNPNAIMEPSIAFIVDTDPPTTSIFGEFDGSLNATVAIGPQPAASGAPTFTPNGANQATQPTRVFITLPQSGAGAAGYVTVSETPLSGSALSSNTVAWTMLKGIAYTEVDTGTQSGYTPSGTIDSFSGTSKQTVTQSLDFRVDLHPWRLSAGAQPTTFTQFSNPFPYYPLMGNLYNAIGDLPTSSGTATLNSTETATVTAGSAQGNTSTLTLSGSATLGATCASTPCPAGSGIAGGNLIFDPTLATCGAPMCLSAGGSYGVSATQCNNPGSCTSGVQSAVFGKLTTMQLPIGLDGQGNFTGGTTQSTTCTNNGFQAGGVTASCMFTLGAGSALYLPLVNQQS